MRLGTLLRYGWTLILFGLALACGLAAYWVLPRANPVYFPDSFDVRIGSSNPIQGVEVDVRTGPSPGRYSVQSSVFVNTSANLAREPIANVTLRLPPGVHVMPCHPEKGCMVFPGGVTSDELTIPGGSRILNTADGQEVIGPTVEIAADHFAWEASEVSVEAELPSVHVFVSDRLTGTGFVKVYYGIATAQFDWIGGPKPDDVGGKGATWTESMTAASSPASAVANNPTAQERDSMYTFVAGALVGFLGGFLTAAMQELIEQIRLRRIRT